MIAALADALARQEPAGTVVALPGGGAWRLPSATFALRVLDADGGAWHLRLDEPGGPLAVGPLLDPAFLLRVPWEHAPGATFEVRYGFPLADERGEYRVVVADGAVVGAALLVGATTVSAAGRPSAEGAGHRLAFETSVGCLSEYLLGLRAHQSMLPGAVLPPGASPWLLTLADGVLGSGPKVAALAATDLPARAWFEAVADVLFAPAPTGSEP